MKVKTACGSQSVYDVPETYENDQKRLSIKILLSGMSLKQTIIEMINISHFSEKSNSHFDSSFSARTIIWNEMVYFLNFGCLNLISAYQ
jgi:hypothetical protein